MSQIETITFKIIDWLPCDEETARNRTPSFGKTSITKDKDGLIDSILTITRNKYFAHCSENYQLPEPFDEFVFEKK